LKDKTTLEICFNKADLNKDGRINPIEFKQMIYTLFKNRTDEDEIIRLFKKFDVNNDGEIVLQGLF
jgi:Ca2+-binding EF-hand superfamily protein